MVSVCKTNRPREKGQELNFLEQKPHNPIKEPLRIRKDLRKGPQGPLENSPPLSRHPLRRILLPPLRASPSTPVSLFPNLRALTLRVEHHAHVYRGHYKFGSIRGIERFLRSIQGIEDLTILPAADNHVRGEIRFWDYRASVDANVFARWMREEVMSSKREGKMRTTWKPADGDRVEALEQRRCSLWSEFDRLMLM